MDEQGEQVTPRNPILRAVWGNALAFLSGLSASGTNVVVKYLDNIFPGQLAVYRFWAQASFVLPQMAFSRERVWCPSTYQMSVLSMAVLAGIGTFLNYFAARYLQLGVATAVFSTYPVFATVAAKIFLKENFDVLQVIVLLMSTVGILLTVDIQNAIFTNSYTTENLYGIFSAIAGALASSAMDVICRKLRTIPSSTLLFHSGIIGVVESIIITTLVGHFTLHCGSHQQGLIILMAILSYVAFFSIAAALKYVEAGRVASMRVSSEMFFSFVWQLTIFEDIPSATTVLGACLVCVSIICIGAIQRRKACMSSRCLNMSIK